MTPRQQNLIKESFGMVAPIADQAAIIFYDRLFELDPSLRPLFAHTDMAAQRKNLMQTLTVVVKSIDKLDTIVPAVEALGAPARRLRRHARDVRDRRAGPPRHARRRARRRVHARVPQRLGRRLHDPVDRHDRRDGPGGGRRLTSPPERAFPPSPP